jgi:hypothetical protein
MMNKANVEIVLSAQQWIGYAQLVIQPAVSVETGFGDFVIVNHIFSNYCLISLNIEL